MAERSEIELLRLVEEALRMAEADRAMWLAEQDLDDGTRARVRQLLVARAEGSPDETRIMPAPKLPAFPKAGERIGSYELIRPLEAGGMGVVFLGRRADDAYEQQVAIKLILPVHLVADPEFRRQLIGRFEAERNILARLNHPNVARILDGGSTADGIPYLVMEFVDGVSLINYCANHNLETRARLELFAKVCDGVQEAHRNLIVHRDLKPDNVLVGADGEPRLLDFGIAKILEREAPDADRGSTALTAMTPAYASPEQVRNETLTTSSDVYSLGVVLYQLLAGVRPYELGGLRPSEAEHMVCETVPEPMRKALERAAIPDPERRARRAELRSDVERIVAKAMHKESSRRYRSAQELADDIRRYLDGQPVLAHPDSSLYRTSKFLRRNRVASGIAALALVSILGATVFAFQQAARAQRAAQDMEQVNQFLVDVLAASDPFESGGEITLAQAVDQAADKIDERFSGRPELSAPIRGALGYSMVSRYQLESAEPLLLQSLAEHRRAFGEADLRTFRIREAIAQLRQEQSDFAAAEAEYIALIADMESSGLHSTPLFGMVLSNLGNLYLASGDYAKADTGLRRAQEWERETGLTRPPEDALAMMSNLAQVAHELGDLKRADELYSEALQRATALRPEGSLETSTLLSNRAYLLNDLSQPEAAMEHWQKASAMREMMLRGDHPMRLTVIVQLARQSQYLDRPDYGLQQAELAVAMAERMGEAQHANLVYALALRASLLSSLGDFTESEASMQRAEHELAIGEGRSAGMAGVVELLRARICREAPPPPAQACPGKTD